MARSEATKPRTGPAPEGEEVVFVQESAPAVWIEPLGNWDVIGAQPILLDGFAAGATNTITFTGDKLHSAPDLDWIEVE